MTIQSNILAVLLAGFLTFTGTALLLQAGAGSLQGRAAGGKTVQRVAVLPFRHAGNDTETESLGAGIADSLTNALSAVEGLTVAEQDVVAEATAHGSDIDLKIKDQDAIQWARQIGVEVLLAGSYHRIGDKIHVDARIITVRAGRVLPGDVIAVEGSYSDVLNRVALSTARALKVPVSAPDQKRVKDNGAAPKTIDAFKLYSRGKNRMRAGTRDALTEAIDLFHQALDKDPEYGLAFAALSQAEQRLSHLKQDSGEDGQADRQAALRDAESSIQKSPHLGAGHRQLSRARSDNGDYAGAVSAGRRALADYPNDAGALLAVSKALGKGSLAPGPELDRALRFMPGMVLVLPDFPRVHVVNNSKYSLQVEFARGSGRYASISLGPEQTRLVGLPPGMFTVTAVSSIGPKSEQQQFEAGKEYTLTYTASSWPVVLVHVVNKTGVPLSFVLGSAKKSIPVGQTSTMRTTPGTHSYRATAGPASLSDQKDFEAGEHTLTFSGGSFPRAVITVRNNASGTLSLQVGAHSLQIGGGSSKDLVLYPGTFNWHASLHGISSGGSKQFEAGQSVWTFEGGDFPSATFTISNNGNIPVRVHISGPTNRSVTVGAGGTKSVVVSPGSYTLSAAAGTKRIVDRYTLNANQEETVTYTVIRTVIRY